MIYCLVTSKHAYTWDLFLSFSGRSLAERMAVVHYEHVLDGTHQWDLSGAHVFCDLDRLSLATRAKLAVVHRALCEACGSARVLNHPLHSMQRYDLLRTLHAAGLNRFGVQWVRLREVPEKYPVLIRPEAGSIYEQLPFLEHPAAYRDAIAKFQALKARLDTWLAVEFCDTADADGVYRKYGAFVVGSRIVPRHLFFSRNWMVKVAELAGPRYLEEELAYIEGNPHAEPLGRIARIAGITYGRIDYSMLDGSVQTWEINTNPRIMSARAEAIPERDAVNREFVAMFEAALLELDLRAYEPPAE